MVHIVMSETEDYEKLVPFFIENGLEFSEEEPVPTDLVKCWEATHGEEKHLAAALVLAKREGEFIIDGIAVEKLYRKMKLGRILLDKAVEETLKRGGKAIYLVARAPEFFRKYGFKTIPREEAPNFFECFTCPQYGKTCTPEVMKLDFE